MSPEERTAHLNKLVTAAEEQCEKLQISLGQANAVLEYLRRELQRATRAYKVNG